MLALYLSLSLSRSALLTRMLCDANFFRSRADARSFSLLLSQITLAKELTILRFKEGDTVLYQGEPATFFGVLLKGELVPVVGGERLTQSQRGIGEVIGEMSLFTGGTRNVSVEAAADGYLAVFSFAQLELLQRANRSLADKLVRQLALAALEKQMGTDGRTPPR